MNIYTKTGDDGTTGLFYGGRVSKADAGPEAYGTVDEAVSVLGVAHAECAKGDELHDLLVRLQRELFVVGAEARDRSRESVEAERRHDTRHSHDGRGAGADHRRRHHALRTAH